MNLFKYDVFVVLLIVKHGVPILLSHLHFSNALTSKNAKKITNIKIIFFLIMKNIIKLFLLIYLVYKNSLFLNYNIFVFKKIFISFTLNYFNLSL